MSYIVSSIPGRIAVRHPLLRDAKRLATLAARLRDLDHVSTVCSSPRAGRLVLHFDASQVAVSTLENLVDTLCQEELALAQPSPLHAKASPPQGMRLNRYAKAVMLTSLGASLTYAALSRKRLHTAYGAIFLGGLAVHLLAHRRRLLR